MFTRFNYLCYIYQDPLRFEIVRQMMDYKWSGYPESR